MKIEDWRSEIDSIDKEILKLVNKRARMAMEIGALKMQSGLPVFDREREQNIIESLCSENAGPIPCDAVIRIFRQIIHETRTIESNVHLQTSSREIA